MDYEKTAQELFDTLLGVLARYGDTAQFHEICAKYPQLLAKFEEKAEEESEKIKLPDAFAAQVKENLRRILDSSEREK